MPHVDRREFIKTTGAATAAAGMLGWAGNTNAGNIESIPSHRVLVLYGLHAYTDKLSVEPGQE